jgi:hypothetical protein
MHVGEDAERAVIAVEVGMSTLEIGEPRPPHERAVAENPQFL